MLGMLAKVQKTYCMLQKQVVLSVSKVIITHWCYISVQNRFVPFTNNL